MTNELRDGSGYDHHGMMTAVALVMGMPGNGSAGGFEAQSLAAIPDHPDFNSSTFTVAMLVKPGFNPGEGGVVDKENQYGVFYNNGAVFCVVVNDAAKTASTGVMVAGGKWSFVACRFDGMNVAMQRYDGASQANQFGLGGALNPASQGGIQIANDRPQLGKPFRGELDRVMFFNRALTNAELCALAGPLCQ